jgi:hypothetical protein
MFGRVEIQFRRIVLWIMVEKSNEKFSSLDVCKCIERFVEPLSSSLDTSIPTSGRQYVSMWNDFTTANCLIN